MASFEEEISSMSFNQYSVVGRYEGKKRVNVILDLDVEQFGAFETKGSARRHEVSFLNAQIPEPKRGHTILIGRKTYTLDGSIEDDGLVSRWHVNAN